MIATGTFCCIMLEGFFRCCENRENFDRDKSVNPLLNIMIMAIMKPTYLPIQLEFYLFEQLIHKIDFWYS